MSARAYGPVNVKRAEDLEALRLALRERSEAFRQCMFPMWEDSQLSSPGPCSGLIQDLLLILRRYNWPVPLDTEEVIEDERIWFDIPHEDGDPLMDAVLLAMKSEHSPLSETEIWQLCYRLAYKFAEGTKDTGERFKRMRDARREAGTRGGRPGEVKGPHRWAWRFLTKHLESLAYHSNEQRYSRYAMSEMLHAEILHTEWRRQHPSAMYAPSTILPSAKTLRESPLWLRGMGFDALPQRRTELEQQI